MVNTMKRIDETTIQLSQEETEQIRLFVMDALEKQWDNYASRFLMDNVLESEGMRRMNPLMYALAEELGAI